MLSPGNEVVPLSVVQERSLSGLVIMTESWGSAPSQFTSLWSHITAWCLLLVSNSSRIRVRDLNQPLTFRVEESIALRSDQMQGSITVAKDTRVCADVYVLESFLVSSLHSCCFASLSRCEQPLCILFWGEVHSGMLEFAFSGGNAGNNGTFPERERVKHTC